MSKEKYEACLVGGAIGDALGGPVEFMTEKGIMQRWPDGVREFISMGAGWPRGTVTDDTQMTLFSCEAVLEGGDLGEAAWDAYKRWYRTQTEPYDSKAGGLLHIPALWVSRAPGSTCLGALSRGHAIPRGTCGGVMRSAPFGLQAKTAEECFDDAATAAALTHGAPGGYLPAGALACIIRSVLDGASLDEAFANALAILLHESGSDETSRLLRVAWSVSQDADTTSFARLVRNIARIGDGFDGPSALAIAVYAVAAGLKAGYDFTGIVSLAVSHGGDSDSTGAIAGNIAGAMLGVSALPVKLASQVEFGDVLAHFAEQLYAEG